MFAMLNGSWPRPPVALDDEGLAVERGVRAQVEAGLDLVTVPLMPAFERAPTPDPVEALVNKWQTAAAIARDIAPSTDAQLTVAAAITGPFTLAAGVAAGREHVPTALGLHDALVGLAAAGCPML